MKLLTISKKVNHKCIIKVDTDVFKRCFQMVEIYIQRQLNFIVDLIVLFFMIKNYWKYCATSTDCNPILKKSFEKLFSFERNKGKSNQLKILFGIMEQMHFLLVHRLKINCCKSIKIGLWSVLFKFTKPRLNFKCILCNY